MDQWRNIFSILIHIFNFSKAFLSEELHQKGNTCKHWVGKKEYLLYIPGWFLWLFTHTYIQICRALKFRKMKYCIKAVIFIKAFVTMWIQSREQQSTQVSYSGVYSHAPCSHICTFKSSTFNNHWTWIKPTVFLWWKWGKLSGYVDITFLIHNFQNQWRCNFYTSKGLVSITTCRFSSTTSLCLQHVNC